MSELETAGLCWSGLASFNCHGPVRCADCSFTDEFPLQGVPPVEIINKYPHMSEKFSYLISKPIETPPPETEAPPEVKVFDKSFEFRWKSIVFVGRMPRGYGGQAGMKQRVYKLGGYTYDYISASTDVVVGLNQTNANYTHYENQMTQARRWEEKGKLFVTSIWKFYRVINAAERRKQENG